MVTDTANYEATIIVWLLQIKRISFAIYCFSWYTTCIRYTRIKQSAYISHKLTSTAWFLSTRLCQSSYELRIRKFLCKLTTSVLFETVWIKLPEIISSVVTTTATGVSRSDTGQNEKQLFFYREKILDLCKGQASIPKSDCRYTKDGIDRILGTECSKRTTIRGFFL